MPPSRHRRRRSRAASRGARSAASLAAARPRKRRVNKLYLLASLIIAVLVIGGFAVGGLSLGGGGGVGTGKNSQYVAGLGEQQPTAISSAHVPRGETVEYSSYPPTSGDHWPPGNQASCGFYPEGLRDERAVHNLEHGNIVVSYNLSSQAEVDQLRKVVDNIDLANVWGVTRFYDRIPEGQVAVAAWGVLDTMQGIDPDRIKRFFEAYSGKLGPEKDERGIGIPC